MQGPRQAGEKRVHRTVHTKREDATMREHKTRLRAVAYAGAVLMAAAAAGTAAAADFKLDRNVLLHEATPDANDMWGRVLAAGDYNGDGRMDLAVGDPSRDVDGKSAAGRVRVAYGSPDGLSLTQSFTQEGFGTGEAEAGDQFGFALAAGDFDGNGWDDLAVGVPEEDVGDVVNAGAVCVLYGSDSGLFINESRKIWTQDDPIIHGSAEASDKFGYTLAAGDVHGDGYDDLAVGCPYEDLGATADAGEVHVIYGSADRLSDDVLAPQDLDQGQAEVPDVAEAGDLFGLALDIGRLDSDEFEELVVGAPFEDIDAVAGAGAVLVFPGSAAGASAAGADWYDWRDTGSSAVPQENMRLGAHVAVGDLPGQTNRNLAMACPGASGGGYDSYGLVIVVSYASGALNHGLYAPNVPFEALQDHSMGTGPLLVADVNNDGEPDLLVGHDRYDVKGQADAGMLMVRYGSGPGYFGRWVFHSQSDPRMSGTPGAQQWFAYALAAGDFDGDGLADVAAGLPGYPAGGEALSGAVSVLYGGSTGLQGALLLLLQSD